ncbi:hypothetical protein [Mesorhizobium sanjuanii]|uniref:hypothetical protein n=1 Tax=Mesorhizobium sanjuanii TaxID=2037900 RepID=UPI001FDEBA94|nr:hypothetical protein [Mesorhizobium sanjuanii]
MANRYALRMEQPDSWTIFDVFTGQPAELKHQIMVGMNTRDANAWSIGLTAGTSGDGQR